MFTEDNQKKGFKVYREHTAKVDQDRKAVQFGLAITDQDDGNGAYTVEKVGDEAGWVFWENNTRATGAWAQAWLCVVGASYQIWPVSDTSLAADTSFSAKTVVIVSATGDNTKARAIDGNLPSSGDYGLVFQAASHLAWELCFMPISSAVLKADHANTPNTSTKVYDVLAGGALGANGTLKDVFRVYDGAVHILSTSEFYFDDGGTIRSAPMKFVGGAVPVGMTEVFLYYDSGSFKWYGTGAAFQVDDASTNSTLIYGTDGSGNPDPANVGKSNDVFKVDSNIAYLLDDAQVYVSASRKGPMAFLDAAFPALVAPSSTPYTVETKLAFDGSAGKWKWYTQIGGDVGFSLAKIRWYKDLEGDRSEGELLTYNNLTNEYTASGTAIYISWDQSKACKFETAGDNTIFAVKKLVSNYDRFGVTRDLYCAVYCEKDSGSQITHFKKSGGNNLFLFGVILAKSLVDPVWDNVPLGSVKTNILGIPGSNVIEVRVPGEWNLSLGNWDWLEVSDLSHGFPFYFRPIDPYLFDIETKIWNSSITFAEAALATYGRKS